VRSLSTFSNRTDDISNFKVWFGEDAAATMVDWVVDNFPASEIGDGKILDCGCGNGHLLFSLVEEDYPEENLLGIDYSDASIQLCQAIAQSKDVQGIQWKTADCLADDITSKLGNFELILDKGTYDAICLGTQNQDCPVHPSAIYVKNIASLLAKDGLFLITSCNWTKDELIHRMSFAGKSTNQQTVNQ